MSTGAPDRRGAVSRLWDEHLHASFPADLLGEEVAGVDLVVLDADLAGCVVVWLADEGRLDAGGRAVVEACARDLARVVPLLRAEDERRYVTRLQELARLVSGRDG